MSTLRRYLPLFGLFLVFFIPWISATLYYHCREHFSISTSHTGLLITPTTPVVFSVTTPEKWRLVFIQPPEATHEPMLEYLDTVQRALGRDKSRVAILALTSMQLAIPEHNKNANLLISKNILLVDPLGRLVLVYSPSTWKSNPKGLLKDLKRLLKVSQIG